MNKKLRIGLMCALAAVLTVSVAAILRQTLQYREGDRLYAEAEAMAGLPDFSRAAPPAGTGADSSTGSSAPPDSSAGSGNDAPVYVDPYAAALRDMDFTALREVNPGVLGWILIPGTQISYPLVQADDNQYYLKRTWRQTASAVGAIFLECQNNSDFSDFNTMVYGHRMNNGSMFAGLRFYKTESYWRQHPGVYITDDNGTRTYEIFAAYEVSTQGDTYRLGFSTPESKQDFIDYCRENSLYDTDVVPTVNDRILTLSTCTGNGHATRWVVQARLKGAEPLAAPEAESGTPEAETPAPEEGTQAAPEETMPEAESGTPEAETPAPEGETRVSPAALDMTGGLPA